MLFVIKESLYGQENALAKYYVKYSSLINFMSNSL